MMEKIAIPDDSGMLRFHDYGMGEFGGGHRIGPRVWPHFDLLVIHSGRVHMQLLRGQSVELTAGQGVLIHPRTHFTGQSLTPLSRASVQHFALMNAEAAGYPSVLRRLRGRDRGYELFSSITPALLEDIERAVRLSRRSSDSSTLHAMREAMLILILAQLFESLSPEADRGAASQESFDFTALSKWLAGRLDRRTSLEEMARHVGISTSHFRALFVRRMGSAPGGYLRQLRHLEATRLLRETALPIKSVARRLGYDDLAHFYRFFAAMTSYTPGEYRRRHRVIG